MKKILAIVLALCLALSLAACGGGGASSTPAASTPAASTPAASTPADAGGDASGLNVGVFYYNYGDTYIASVRTALDAALTAKGVTYQDYDGNNNQATQNDAIQTALSNGTNLLVVNLVNSGSPDAAKAIMDMAGDVPVIFFNRAVDSEDAPDATLKSSDKIGFIGTDAPEAGHLQGQMIGEYLLANYDKVDLNGDGVISYAMFKGDEANVEAIYRTQYGQEDADKVLTDAGKPAMAYFDPNNSSKYQVDQGGAWSAAAALDYMNTNLSQYNDANGNMIELVICNNDGMAEGVISALNGVGYNTGDDKAIPVFGVDATEAAQLLISEGKMTGTVKQDAEGMANAIANAVEGIGAGSSVTDAIAAAAAVDTAMYSIADGVANKLYVAYAPYMG